MKVAFLSLVFTTIMNPTVANDEVPISPTDLTKAFRLYREAASIFTEVTNEVYTNLGYSEDGDISEPKFNESQLQRLRKCTELLHQSSGLNPYNPEAYMYLGLYYLEVSPNKQMALDYFSRALDIDPFYESIVSLRFHTALELKNFDVATSDLATLKKLGVSDYPQLESQLKEAKQQ